MRTAWLNVNVIELRPVSCSTGLAGVALTIFRSPNATGGSEMLSLMSVSPE